MTSVRTRARIVGAVVAVALPGVITVSRAQADPRPAGGAFVGRFVAHASGPLDVVVRLSQPSMAATVDPAGSPVTDGARVAAAAAVTDQQDHTMSAAAKLGASETARLRNGLNALVLHVDASHVAALAKLPGVTSIQPVTDDDLAAADSGRAASLARAATYLKVDALRARGLDGSGVKLAVIDSGIDFTHYNLGGPGTADAYAQCYVGADPNHPAYAAAPVGPCAALFGPDAPKVKGGYDFVGEQWPNGPVAPDPNPIDAQGHGTHVADIAGGRSADGQHLGIAPGVDLYAYKACSALSQRCNGTALLQAIDRALDPNGDGNLDDAVDIMNLSLGQNYGQAEDDLTLAVNNAVHAGVTVVASAGNGGNRPFVVSGPATALGAIAVGQTSLPDNELLPFTVIDAGGTATQVRYAVPQPWSPRPTTALAASLAAPGAPEGCAAADWWHFPKGSVALVQRGTCAVTAKVDAARQAGAVAAVVYDNVDEAPPIFLPGAGNPAIPTVVVSAQVGDSLVNGLAAGAVSFRLDPANAVNLANTVEASSARGPSLVTGGVKPDLVAPGDWISADAGRGTGDSNFGGTSGAAPTVAGIAALLKQARPTDAPTDLKRRLVGNAKAANQTLDDAGNFYPSPVTRAGGGEVQAERAVDAVILAGDAGNGDGNLSLGFRGVNDTSYAKRFITLTNSADVGQWVHLALTFREAADDNGAVSMIGFHDFFVQPHGTNVAPVIFAIAGSRLPAWPLSGLAGLTGNDATRLDRSEIDGTLVATPDQGPPAIIGWSVLPRRSSQVAPPAPVTLDPDGSGPLTLVNDANAEAASGSAFELLGRSARLPTPLPGQPGSPGSNTALVDLQAVGAREGIAGTSRSLDVLISAYDRRATPNYPAAFQLNFDTDGDGRPDHLVFNQERSGIGIDGRNQLFMVTLPDPTPVAIGYTDADYRSSAITFSIPLSSLGVADGQTVHIDAYGADSYFNHSPQTQITDSLLGMTYTIGAPHFALDGGDDITVPLPWGSSVTRIVRTTGSTTPSSASGLLIRLRNDSANDALIVPVS